MIKRKKINWPGRISIQIHFLDPLNLSITGVWIADSLKCRLKDKDGRRLFDLAKQKMPSLAAT